MPGKILLADDNEPFRRSVAVILEEVGYEVAEAGSANEALAQLKAPCLQFDLLITALYMPGMDGSPADD